MRLLLILTVVIAVCVYSGEAQKRKCVKSRRCGGAAPPPPPPKPKACKKGWQENFGRCFQFRKSVSKSWDDGQADCKKLDGRANMVSIASVKELAFVRKNMDNKRMWLGLKRKSPYFWISGNEKEAYRNWFPGEPNNYQGKEDCGHFRSAGKWNDIGCGQKFGYVCKKSQNKGKCPAGYEKGGSFCYKFRPAEKDTWDKSQAKCKADGANLATIVNKQENDYIRQKLFLANNKKYDHWWIGMRRRVYAPGKRQLFWVSGNKAAYRNYANKEPNNPMTEMCGEMYTSGQWNDWLCKNKLPYACEMPKV